MFAPDNTIYFIQLPPDVALLKLTWLQSAGHEIETIFSPRGTGVYRRGPGPHDTGLCRSRASHRTDSTGCKNRSVLTI
eukprot:12420377-Karenia_brevis.AAC.1